MNKMICAAIARNDDGSVNVDATRVAFGKLALDAYAKDLEKAEKKCLADFNKAAETFDADLQGYIETRGAWDVLSAKYIGACFDRFKHTVKGGIITKPVLVGMCTADMIRDTAITFADHKLAQEMLVAYVDDNTSKPDEVTEQTLFTVHKGEGGGYRRVVRAAPAAPTAPVQE